MKRLYATGLYAGFRHLKDQPVYEVIGYELGLFSLRPFARVRLMVNGEPQTVPIERLQIRDDGR